MAYIKNGVYLKIAELAKNGDERAKALLDHYMRKDYKDQEDLDRMVGNIFNPEPEIQEPAAQEQEEVEDESPAQTVEVEEGVVEDPTVVAASFDVIDGDMDGLIDKTEIEDITFSDFLSNKKRDAERARKNHDYFLMYDADARNDYLTRSEEDYSKSFDALRGDIDRSHRDMEKALSDYALSVGDLADDGRDISDSDTSSAYDGIIDHWKDNHSFGRSWDEEDKKDVLEILNALVEKYGRKNVLGALNILKGDNDAYKAFRTGKIDSAIDSYSKSLEKILK